MSLLPGDDVADDGVPAGGADRVGRAWSDEVVQPVRLGAGELADTDGDGTVDGPLQDGDLVTVGAESDHGVGPRRQPLLQLDAGSLQRVGGSRGEIARRDVTVEDRDVLPGQVSFCDRAVVGHEPDADGPGGVVDADDGADVVSVERLDR